MGAIGPDGEHYGFGGIALSRKGKPTDEGFYLIYANTILDIMLSDFKKKNRFPGEFDQYHSAYKEAFRMALNGSSRKSVSKKSGELDKIVDKILAGFQSEEQRREFLEITNQNREMLELLNSSP